MHIVQGYGDDFKYSNATLERTGAASGLLKFDGGDVRRNYRDLKMKSAKG
jgi:hypothetical protein